MITEISLKNFRQHRDLSLQFGPGMVALRGVNEAGKSTVLEGIMFGLFGIRACRNSDVCTWGEPEKSTKVELRMQLPAGDLHIVRSKTGAEARLNDRVVTGQTECTRFVEDQLLLQPGLGPKLMIATQKAIQGVLDEKGGQAATELIEELADLAVIDRVIEKVQAKYPTGNTKAVESRIETASNQIVGHKDAVEQLTLAGASLPTEEDIAAADQDVDGLAEALDRLQGDLDGAKQLRDEAVRSNDTRAKVIRQMNAAEDSLQAVQSSRAKLGNDAPVAPDCILDTDQIEAQLRQAKAKQKHFKLFNDFMKEKATAVAVEGAYEWSRTHLKSEIARTTDEINIVKESIAVIPQRIATLEAKKVAASVCGFCDKDVSQFPEVAEKNADLDRQIAAEREELLRCKGELATASEMLVQLRAQFNLQSLNEWFERYPDHFTMDDSVCPEIVNWNGKPPADQQPEIDVLEENLAAVNRWKAADAQYRKQQANLDRQIAEAQATLLAEQERVATLPPCQDTTALSAVVDRLQEDLLETSAALARAKARKAEMVSTAQAHANQMAAVKQALLDAELRLSEAKDELDEINFNNGLIKKLRVLRPEIANKIWNNVLGAVSHYFSAMRGTQSMVSRDGALFLVDGKPVSSYSGSTMDVLGLALRVALIRTFLPTCSFMLLDEPFAACDDGRQTAALGFLAGAGFQQTLIITHEDISETVADSLLTI